MPLPFCIEKLIRLYKIWKRGPRAANDHATNIPVLCALGLLFEVRSVLELGSGLFSTLSFLNKDLFPDLEFIHSYENNPEWHAKVNEQTRRDNRITLTYVDGPLAVLVPGIELSTYDLIFIDDGTKAAVRAESIKAVVRHHSPHNVIVVHDFDVETYIRAAEGVSKQFTMKAYNPHTGILWDAAALTTRQLRLANRLIRKNVHRLEPTDAHTWHEVLKPLAKKRY